MEIVSENNFNIYFRNYKNEELKISVKIDKVIDKGVNYYQVSYLYNEMYVMDMEDFSDFKNRRVYKLLVIQNSLTEKIVEYLKMSDDSLSKFTGTVTPLEYKKQLLILFMKLSD